LTYSSGASVSTILNEYNLNIQVPVSNTDSVLPIQISDEYCVGTVSGSAGFISENIIFTVDTIGTCEGFPRTFEVLTTSIHPTSSCSWDMGDGTIINGCGPINHEYLEVGCYDVNLSISGTIGCVASTTIPEITCLYEPPIASFNWEPTIPTVLNNQLSLFNASEDDVTVQWFVDDIPYSSDEITQYPLQSFTDSNTRICLAIESSNTCVDTICRNFSVIEDPVIYIPNAFTPSGDGINDEFYPVVQEMVFYEFEVYDRWGQQVFYSVIPNQKWDGKVDGELVSMGIYVWKLSYEDINANKDVLVGKVFVDY